MIQDYNTSVEAMGKLGRRNLSQAVADELIRRIDHGQLRPGDRLPTEQGLTDMFGVGRNTIREAVQSLVARGMVEVRPRRGAIVLGVSSHKATDALTMSALLEDQATEDLYEFRRILEVEVAARAAERATAGDLEVMQNAIADYAEALERGLSTHSADVAFHRALAATSHNTVYLRVLDSIADALMSARLETARIPWAAELALKQHSAILDAVGRGDHEGARAEMAEHLTSAKRALDEARKRGRKSADRAPARPT